MPGWSVPRDRLYYVETQHIKLEPFECDGLILDIGGGGEGVIGLLQRCLVIAIDNRRSELDEAPSGPVKAVMDATDLHFMDETFDVAVAFFSLMYIPMKNRATVFDECYRVLRPGGRFLIWDAVIPPRHMDDKDLFVVPLRIQIPGQIIQTSYGVPWDDRHHDLSDYRELAARTGFEVVSDQQTGRTFRMTLRKPAQK
jgi:ubiquinone/menaquinone biosynthesis C-methylase UbiE